MPADGAAGSLEDGLDGLKIEDWLIDYFDVYEAIESSSSLATLDELSRQGYTTVKVLDVEKIGALIKQAVNEAIADRTAGLVEKERHRIEEQSRKRFEQLLAQQSQATATVGSTPDIMRGLDLDRLTDTIADAVHNKIAATNPGLRLDAIEEKMHKLISMLEMVENMTARMSAAGPRGWRASKTEAAALGSLRKAMLEEILKTNLELRTMQGQPGEQPAPAAEPATHT